MSSLTPRSDPNQDSGLIPFSASPAPPCSVLASGLVPNHGDQGYEGSFAFLIMLPPLPAPAPPGLGWRKELEGKAELMYLALRGRCPDTLPCPSLGCPVARCLDRSLSKVAPMRQSLSPWESSHILTPLKVGNCNCLDAVSSSHPTVGTSSKPLNIRISRQE